MSAVSNANPGRMGHETARETAQELGHDLSNALRKGLDEVSKELTHPLGEQLGRERRGPTPQPPTPDQAKFAVLESIPFFIMHLAPIAAIWAGTRPVDWAVCGALYVIRMFGITAGYHRYFSHRAYKVGRVTQFILALIGCVSAQKGPLWWAAHHRHHHKHSDMPDDIHSPKRGFWWSHCGWMLTRSYNDTDYSKIKDFAKYPELVWMNKLWLLPPTLLGLATFAIGGWSMLLIGFVLSTVLLWHGTFTINSLSHVFGSRRFATTDTSRNNGLLALLTLGEGWHNNHHHYMSSANQGFYWWEFDISYYVIRLMGVFGLAWDIRKPTPKALARNRIEDGAFDVGLKGEPKVSTKA